MLSVSEHYRADIADAVTVNEHSACGHGGGAFERFFAYFRDSAVIGDEYILLGDTHTQRETRVLSQVLELAVNRNEIFRLDDAHNHFQLLLAGVAGDMNLVHLLIYDIRAELHQLVDDAADGLFVAGDRRCRDYNIIVRVNFDLAVIGERHTGQSTHRLALAARGDYNELVGGIAVYHIDIDDYPLGDIEITELRRDAHDIFKASADERDLAPEARRNIHYLLHAVDI